ncbi:MAG: hypothetical protein J6K43_09250 [Lachnospiraceae bacterium]|nr:hypothetical protein [Lachnospiraceae bacterium]
MKEPQHHFLDTIYPNNSLLMLEAMIPYVDSSLKLPLALLIKVQEIQLIMQVLNNPARMEACGLNRSSNNSEELLSALCQAMGVDIMGQMKNMQNMMNMMNTMNTMNTMDNIKNMSFKTPTEESKISDLHTISSDEEHQNNTEGVSGFSSDTRNDMIDAIRQILSEQEGDLYES